MANIITRKEWIETQIRTGRAVVKVFHVPKHEIYSKAQRFNWIRRRLDQTNEVLVQYAAFPCVLKQRTTESTIYMEVLVKKRQRYSKTQTMEM